MKVTNIKHSFYLIPLLSLIFFSCESEPSSSVDQDFIYAEYRLVYEASMDKSFGRVDFHFSDAFGEKLELSDPATITLDGSALAWKPLFSYYERDFAGVKDSGEYEYVDLDGMVFVNQVRMAAPIDLPAALDSIQKGSSYSLSWVGDPISLGETVTVTVNGPNEGDARIFTTSDPGANAIILSADKINDLGIGLGRIVIERRLDQAIDQGTSKGGAIWSRYVSSTKEIQISL